MDILKVLLGQLPEAIYFALFMIFAKKLVSKRLLFVILMVAEYILLINALHFSVWAHVLYFTMSYMILKMLYKERSQITDIFTLGIASLGLILISSICYMIVSTTVKDIILCNIIAKGILFLLLFIFKNKLYNIQKLYKRLWRLFRR